MTWIIASLVGLTFAGIVWYLVAGVRLNATWQSGESPLAKFLNNRRRAQFNAKLPEVLSTMNNALRAGLSLNQALETVMENSDSPVKEEFKILTSSMQIGMSLEDAFNEMQNRVGSEDLTLVVTAILISRKSGGNLTEIFEKISETIRGRQKIERKVRTLTAQGRLQGVIVSLMPVFLAIVMTIIKPGMMLPFFFSPIGVASILAMIVLIALGWLMILKIIKIDI